MLLDTSLLYFHEVAQCGSIRRAADILHVSPSAISRMIAKLEHHFQTELFERHPGGMVLTATGTALADQVGDMFHSLKLAQTRIDELKGLMRGTVSVQCIEGLASEVVPSFLTRFHQIYPNVTFTASINGTDQIVEALLSDKTDLGIAFNMGTRTDVESLLSIQQRLHVLVSPDHPLASNTTVSLQEAFKYPVALSNTSFGTRRIVDAAVEALAIKEPPYLLTANSLSMTYGMARAGSCLTLSIPLAARQSVSAGELVMVPLTEHKHLIGHIALCKRHNRQLSAAAQEMVRFIESEFAQIPCQ